MGSYLFISPPVVFWVSSFSSSSSSFGWLQNKGTDPKMCTLNTGALNERGCKTHKKKKERRKHIFKSQGHVYALLSPLTQASKSERRRRREGGGIASFSVNRGHLCLCAWCVNTWYTWAALPSTETTASGQADGQTAQNYIGTLCVRVCPCLRYDCLVVF